MINRVIDYCDRNRVFVLVLILAATIAGWASLRRIPVDALPDLGNTEVIVYSRWDQPADLIEDQVTYPIVRALAGAPHVKTVRGASDFGSSYVYVVFEDGTDLYWARSRTQEYLSTVLSQLPAGVKTELGPDATALGWAFQYALIDESGAHSLGELRKIQDWFLRYQLKSVPGVAEVASVGGFEQQYQVQVNRDKLRAFGLSVQQVTQAIRAGNNEVGGRVMDLAGSEYMIRGRGYARTASDLENIMLSATASSSPVRVRDVGQVVLGPELRRGSTDLDGRGERVSGIVILRQGVNTEEVVRNVKQKLGELSAGLPPGVKVIPVYDRSAFIERATGKLKETLIEVILTVVLVIFLFLRHPTSSLIPIITIPVTLLIACLAFHMLGLTANIMSLGGITIAVGALVDAAIVVVEQTHKRLEESQNNGSLCARKEIILDAVKEVAGPSFFALLVIGVSFLPILILDGPEGRLFRPFVYTKTLCMVIGALLAVTLDPILRVLLIRVKWVSFGGTIRKENANPVIRLLKWVYLPVASWALRHKWLILTGVIAAMIATIPVYRTLGSELMPSLDEGTLLYMPTTEPSISIAEAKHLLSMTDSTIRSFPEVEHVFGKAGRAETATDPAPLSMLETVITLKPRSQWRARHTWYSAWAPKWSLPIFRQITSDRISREQLVADLDAALQIPGVSNAWTMPVRGRIDMLNTGIRTAVGVKITGPDFATIDRVSSNVASLLRSLPATRSVFPERLGGGRYVDINWNREALANYGLSVADAQAAVQNAIGGEDVSVVVDERARYPVSVRYLRDFRSDIDSLKNALVSAPDGQRNIPVSEIAEVKAEPGPSMLRDEDGLLTGYVYIDVDTTDVGQYVGVAREMIRRNLSLPIGCSISWSGQYEAMRRLRDQFTMVVPLTLLLVFVLLYLNTGSLAKTAIILTAVPFSAIGAFGLLYLLHYNLSAATWVGIIALLGIDAETGVFMLLYLDQAYGRAQREGRMRNLADLRQAILGGAVQRIRPKFMTAATLIIGLVPILWADGPGVDVLKRIAAPIIGGIITSFVLELILYPVLFELWMRRRCSVGVELKEYELDDVHCQLEPIS